ncbi:sulfotransferase [Ruegeria arenilitoris]|uniref:sulfotransferase n=1 Tax=Ruegeria arenilitoris TaxID=1173585 RepID=UPI0014803C29|nr:sulfotransferase [Ruegeria arenilitoris]
MKALAKSALRGTVHTVLAPLEAQMLKRQPEAKWPHIFILGAPRSGTSLFYELMATQFAFACFTNLAHRFYKTPLAATKLGRSFISRHKPAYQSDYGHISGWAAPNEGGWIWQRWLEDGPWVNESKIVELPVDEIRSTLAGMSNLSAAPFINKNVMHSNRVRLLDALFPGCLFLEVQRDAKETARSIVRAQRRNKGPEADRDEWWSVRPSNAGGDTDIERACRQVVGVTEDIARDCAQVGADRHFIIDYATLCATPESILSDVARFLSEHNVPALALHQDPVPERFTLSPSRPLDDNEETRLDDMLRGAATKMIV